MPSRGHDDEEAASRLLPSAPTSPTTLGSSSPATRPRRCWRPLALTLLMVNIVSAVYYVISSSNATKDQGVWSAVELPSVPSGPVSGRVSAQVSYMEPIANSILEAKTSSSQVMDAPKTSATPLQAAQRLEFCAKIDRMLVEFPYGFLPSHLKVMSVEPKPDVQQPHLLGESRLARSYHRPSPQDPAATACHAHRLFKKLVWPDGDGVLIDVIGTSVTHGSWCTKKKGHEPLCAWPERLQRYLTHAFPERSFTLVNSARAGGNIKCFAEDDIYWLRWQKGKVDLLLADHELNNIVLVEKAAGRSIQVAASEGAKWTNVFLDRLRKLEKPPSLAFVKTFILSKEAQDCETACPTEHWQGQTFCACNWWWDMHDWDTQELSRRRVPVISYRDAVWPVFENMTDSFKPTYWPCVADGIHPSWEAHRVYADMVAHGLLNMLRDVCHSDAILSPTDDPPAHCSAPPEKSQTSSGAAEKESRGGGGGGAESDPSYPEESVVQCRAGGRVSAVMSAEDKEGTHFEASVRSGGWAFKTDEKHRKSWTVEVPSRGRGSDPKATIGFPITILGDVPTLIEVTYLKSNRGIGDVRVYTSTTGPSPLSSSEPSLTLKGTWDEQYSLPQTIKIVIPSKDGDHRAVDRGDPDLLYLASTESGPTTLYFELLRPTGRPKDAQTRFNLFEIINCELER